MLLDGERYIVPNGLSPGMWWNPALTLDIKPGNNLPLRNTLTGTLIPPWSSAREGGLSLRARRVEHQLLGKEASYDAW